MRLILYLFRHYTIILVSCAYLDMYFEHHELHDS